MIEIKANSNFLYKEETGTPFVFLDHNTKKLLSKSKDNIIKKIMEEQFNQWTNPLATHLVSIFWWEE